MEDEAPHVPLDFIRYGPTEMLDRARQFHGLMDRRRTIRYFSDEPVPFDVIAEVVRTANTAPSGAHKQPWTFCVVGNPALKHKIREAAEQEEKINYAAESVGIATGMLLAAAHNAGLATLTHTPSPMNFLAGILDRPSNERPFLLIPIGFPAKNCQVPDLKRKGLDHVLVPFK